jgi:hypothetical protein
MKEETMLTLEEFCQYFKEDKPEGYAPIVDAYIQYKHDFVYGGGVMPDAYYRINNKTNK